jgi:hypothetical protein
MDYKLAKQLKDAGFPHNLGSTLTHPYWHRFIDHLAEE